MLVATGLLIVLKTLIMLDLRTRHAAATNAVVPDLSKANAHPFSVPEADKGYAHSRYLS